MKQKKHLARSIIAPEPQARPINERQRILLSLELLFCGCCNQHYGISYAKNWRCPNCGSTSDSSRVDKNGEIEPD